MKALKDFYLGGGGGGGGGGSPSLLVPYNYETHIIMSSYRATARDVISTHGKRSEYTCILQYILPCRSDISASALLIP